MRLPHCSGRQGQFNPQRGRTGEREATNLLGSRYHFPKPISWPLTALVRLLLPRAALSRVSLPTMFDAECGNTTEPVVIASGSNVNGFSQAAANVGNALTNSTSVLVQGGLQAIIDSNDIGRPNTIPID